MLARAPFHHAPYKATGEQCAVSKSPTADGQGNYGHKNSVHRPPSHSQRASSCTHPESTPNLPSTAPIAAGSPAPGQTCGPHRSHNNGRCIAISKEAHASLILVCLFAVPIWVLCTCFGFKSAYGDAWLGGRFGSFAVVIGEIDVHREIE